jgi:hypothetical protein
MVLGHVSSYAAGKPAALSGFAPQLPDFRRRTLGACAAACVRRPSPGTSAGSKAQEVEMASETGQVTGTKDKDYNVIWFTEACLSNVLRLETYIEDAEREGDSELADFFRRAQGESRKGAEQGKALLAQRLAG